MEFSDVVQALRRERDYQRLRWGRQQDGELQEARHEPAAFLIFMDTYLQDAKRAETFGLDGSSLDLIRKVTALGIACLEQHGCPMRAGGDVVNMRDGLRRELA